MRIVHIIFDGDSYDDELKYAEKLWGFFFIFWNETFVARSINLSHMTQEEKSFTEKVECDVHI